MSNLKTHFVYGCGRGKRTTEDVSRVTCLNCKASPLYRRAKTTADIAAKAAFDAQVPREFAEPWRKGIITCGGCQGVLFRDAGRSCHGHYQDYTCANCGAGSSRLTETGMSF